MIRSYTQAPAEPLHLPSPCGASGSNGERVSGIVILNKKKLKDRMKIDRRQAIKHYIFPLKALIS